MFRYKSYRRTIAIAGSIILLCLVSIVGVTLALFTNDVSDGTIGINATTGRVDVDIVDQSGESLVDQYLRFENVAPGESILVEPGATYYTQCFHIENEGTVPVNFRVYISSDSDIDQQRLAEAFDFYLTTDPTDPSSDVSIKKFVREQLAPGTISEPFYLVIRMKEELGEEFENQVYGIGITVYATQGNVSAE